MTKLNELIKESGLKKEYIAKNVGVSIWTITNWCKGVTWPTLQQALKLKDILRLDSIDDLVTKK